MNNTLWRYAQCDVIDKYKTLTILHKKQCRAEVGEKGMVEYKIYRYRTLQKYKTASILLSVHKITLKKHHLRAFPSHLKHLNLSWHARVSSMRLFSFQPHSQTTAFLAQLLEFQHPPSPRPRPS